MSYTTVKHLAFVALFVLRSCLTGFSCSGTFETLGLYAYSKYLFESQEVLELFETVECNFVLFVAHFLKKHVVFLLKDQQIHWMWRSSVVFCCTASRTAKIRVIFGK